MGLVLNSSFLQVLSLPGILFMEADFQCRQLTFVIEIYVKYVLVQFSMYPFYV